MTFVYIHLVLFGAWAATNLGLTYWFPNKYFHKIMHGIPNLRPQNAGELFRMAQNCRASDSWSSDLARGWWEMHLPELCGPLIVRERVGV